MTFTSITDLNVDILINTGHAEDFRVSLRLGGTTVPLVIQRATPNFAHASFFSVTFDDEAANDIDLFLTDGDDYVGVFRPSSPLSAFDGMELNGFGN